MVLDRAAFLFVDLDRKPFALRLYPEGFRVRWGRSNTSAGSVPLLE